ncbi:multiple myeloma tumor-associated protein 2 homolog [Dysidea avara]|uniref:multiple myeloma tumor-associated protein 2 homolog n=1 Tax=Dysidea avara TaxID=196820 RepID=UPI00331BE0A3
MSFSKRVAGGKDRFKWDEVKVDKDRENYLGHSLMAPVGRWQKNKDLQWYAKGDQRKNAAATKPPLEMELAAVRQQEEEAMAIALGIKKPSVAKLGTTSLTKQEIAEICKREDTEDNEVDEKSDAHRMQGLGYRNHRLAILMSGNVVEKESLKGTAQQPVARPTQPTMKPDIPASEPVMPVLPPSEPVEQDQHHSSKKKKHKKSSKHKSKHLDSSDDERHRRKSKKVKKMKESKKRKRHDSDSD